MEGKTYLGRFDSHQNRLLNQNVHGHKSYVSWPNKIYATVPIRSIEEALIVNRGVLFAV